MRARLTERIISFLSPLLLLAVWEVATRAGWLNKLFFPPPSSIVGTLRLLWERGVVQDALGATLARLLLGFGVGAAPAVLLGLVLGLSRPLRLLILPAANIIYSIPKIAILPLVLLVLGTGEQSKIAVTALSVFFLVLVNTVAGVQGIDPRFFDVARDFGASRWQAYRTVALPGALPLILAGAKLGLGFALIVVVGTEFVAPRSGGATGLGILIWDSWQVLNIEAMYVGLILTAALGWALNLAMDEIEVALLPWRAERAGGVGRVRPERHLAGVPVRVWWCATRPFSFTATIIPVALGAILAPATASWPARLGLFALTLVGYLGVHAGANMINDYYDHRNGLDDADSLGPAKAIQQGLLSERQVLLGGLAAFALGAILGLILVALRGPAILILGLICLPLAFFYTGWPLKLAYHGLGEIVVASSWGR
jgi:NitT/TauT family transport system permease protein